MWKEEKVHNKTRYREELLEEGGVGKDRGRYSGGFERVENRGLEKENTGQKSNGEQ